MRVVGIDEVGRGCLAGPLLVVAARQITELPDRVADSKILPKKRREELFGLLVDACQFGEGWVRPVEINQRGLTGAMRLGVARALKHLGVNHKHEIIMDGPVNYFSARYKKVQCIIDADANFPIVSAASIYAKVRRDRYMAELAKRHPHYGFDSHVGYATKLHILALNKHGSLKHVHRQFFGTVQTLNELSLWPAR